MVLLPATQPRHMQEVSAMVKVAGLAFLLGAFPFTAHPCPPAFRTTLKDCQDWDYEFQQDVSQRIVNLETQMGQLVARLQAMQNVQDRHDRLLGFMLMTPLQVTPSAPGMPQTAQW